MGKMTIGKKILSAFSIVIVLLITISIITYTQFKGVDNSYSATIEDRSTKIEIVTEILSLTDNEIIALQDYLVSGNEEEIRNLYAIEEEIKIKIEEINANTTNPEAKQLIEKIIKAESDYITVAEKMIALKQQGNTEMVLQIMKTDGKEARKNLSAGIDALINYQQQELHIASDALSKTTVKTINVVLAISILSIVISILIALIISRMISRPVISLTAAVGKIANGDLTGEKITIRNRDEIGQLATGFNTMTQNLKTLLNEVNVMAEQVAASSEQLMASTEQTTYTTNQVAGSIQEVASAIDTQGKNTEESAVAMNEISTGIQRIADSSSLVAESVTDTATQSNKGYGFIQEVSNQMNAIFDTSEFTKKTMQQLESRSNEIGQIIEAITSIADQTNLLALNAAIESARAGEHGKGFAVVADEVRKLAEQSRESANQIAEIIQLIQKETEKAVATTENENEEVKKGLEVVKETGNAFIQILQSVENVNAQTQELAAVSEQISASIEEVTASVDEVAHLAKNSSKNTQEIAAAAEEQLATIEEVSSSAASLSEMAEKLRTLVSQFKI
ncbi:methyl-accepting chemotaxis protein [Lysinibacillus sp. KU-BSD001]|uniref:methyl-accepting chemotaxis protein n=1 Tax=Lysinibacillus sp. KU-BSD001 TaxID=3141328 RepID=UPI0036E0BBDB